MHMIQNKYEPMLTIAAGIGFVCLFIYCAAVYISVRKCVFTPV